MKRTVKARLAGKDQAGTSEERELAHERLRLRRIRWARGLSLVELLVVVMIIAAISALITTSVLSALQQQNKRICLNNMLTIEAAKDEYIRDHPGATSIPSIPAFQPYFRFGIPRCPDRPNDNYQNLLNLTQPVTCLAHPENTVNAAPSP
jgi:prepilin-type N-terminal cleavage/methylation domain-containing protein